jgi:hypothetical protein
MRISDCLLQPRKTKYFWEWYDDIYPKICIKTRNKTLHGEHTVNVEISETIGMLASASTVLKPCSKSG